MTDYEKNWLDRLNVGRMTDDIGDDTIDTTNVPYSGWETAVINEKVAAEQHCSAVSILERYKTEEEAKVGHAKWVQKAKDGTLDDEETS
jgi:hypothetical protein